MWQPLETPADSERRRRPLDDLPRLDILAGGELDEEAAVKLVGTCPRGGAEIAGGPVCGSAAQRPLPFRELHRVDKARPWSDPLFAVGLDEEVPAVGAEREAVVFDAADLGATARVVKPPLAARLQLLLERGREEPEEGPGEARLHDMHRERRAWGRVRDVRGDRLVPSQSEHDEAGEQRQRDDDQRFLHSTVDIISGRSAA